MATYAIGDIQGCYSQLQQLLELIEFSPERDVLWAVGDLVNRGPDSAETLRFFRNLGDRAVVVLGNHDIHLLGLALGYRSAGKRDTLQNVLTAGDRQDLLDWLRTRPLIHYDPVLDYAMVHAGLPPQWSFAEAQRYSREVEQVLSGPNYEEFFAHVPDSTPDIWSSGLTGWTRLHFFAKCLTRIRYCNEAGQLLMKNKMAPDLSNPTPNALPWFQHPERASRSTRIIFGHWSTLGFYDGDNVTALDTGALWGRELTAMRLEDRRFWHLPCPPSQQPS